MSKETKQILSTVAAWRAEKTAALATVVDLKGSGYRLPGARMLILGSGEAIGTVSGGCLEADVMERAKRVVASGRAELFTYDTTAHEDSVFSLNMGCRGVMRILLEPVGPNSSIITKLRQVYATRQSVIAAVAITGAEIGKRIFVRADEIDDPDRLASVVSGIKDDLLTFAGSTSLFETIEYEFAGELAEFAFETLRPPVQLLILGAGADAVPLAEVAYLAGWQVRVYDHRPAFLTSERFSRADELVTLDREQPVTLVADDRTAIVSMNHNYDRDKAMIAAALKTDAFFIGALGPKKRTTQIFDELGLADDLRSRVHSPLGLDIGGDTPEMIAVSIVAEIQSVLKHRPGGPLRDRSAPIYDHA